MSANSNNTPATYRDAGVDIEAGDELVNQIKPFAKRTMRPEVMSAIGGFGSMFAMPTKFKEPVLVSGTDGVGTKLKLAFELNQHDTVGIDLVAMSVNDILVQGAEPLFFLDYFACGKLDVGTAADVVKGIAAGCEESGCALVGGETAEMPGMYPAGEYDLAGFVVGCVDKANIIDGATITKGDVVLGLASSGAHSNGYSLIRKLIEKSGVDMESDFEGRKFKDVVMTPTKLYVKSILALLEALPVKGMAHITGGGITENIPRVLPVGLTAEISSNSWELPPLFKWLKAQGNITDLEMYKTFNCGVGMAIIMSADNAAEAMKVLEAKGETVYQIGQIRTQGDGEAPTVVV
ncbi:MAG TPA: phosphoribosylformylglycinamidine cyclo-ligase [Methylophilaceae bacterium]|nr:phosphoribosylformylglycinamidine cyclo-ligase [Methylophilaceae bacterium]